MGFLDEPIRTAHAVVFGVPAQGGLSSVPIFYTAARSCELAKLRWYLNTMLVMKSVFMDLLDFFQPKITLTFITISFTSNTTDNSFCVCLRWTNNKSTVVTNRCVRKHLQKFTLSCFNRMFFCPLSNCCNVFINFFATFKYTANRSKITVVINREASTTTIH